MTFKNLSQMFGQKKAEPDTIEQRDQDSIQKSLMHYRFWAVFLVYRRREILHILQATGDSPMPPTPDAVTPAPITPDQLLAQIDTKVAEQPETEAVTDEQDPTDQLLARIEATAGTNEHPSPFSTEEPPVQPDDTQLAAPIADNRVSEASNNTSDPYTEVEEADADTDISYADIPSIDIPSEEMEAIQSQISFSDEETSLPDDGILAAFSALEEFHATTAAQSEDAGSDSLASLLTSIPVKPAADEVA